MGHLGDGGVRRIEGALPGYTVFQALSGKQVTQGTLRGIGADESSGDFVYRMDLSSVPEGGPYRISVEGYGCSHPFGVGGDFSRRLSHVSFRALYHQRCGCPIVEPCAYYAVEKYLLTGDEAAHQIVREMADHARAYAETYNGPPESFAGARGSRGRDGWLASFFFSYVVAKDRPTDEAVVGKFKAAIKAAADKQSNTCMPTPTRSERH